MSESEKQYTEERQNIDDVQNAVCSLVSNACKERELCNTLSSDSNKRLENKAAKHSRLYRERHREEINKRRREVRQRKQVGDEISINVPGYKERKPKNEDSSNLRLKRQQRYYETHKEEINQRKRDRRLQRKRRQSGPVTATERSQSYRERHKHHINERRRDARSLRHTGVLTEYDISSMEVTKQIMEATTNTQRRMYSWNISVTRDLAQSSSYTSLQHTPQLCGEIQSDESITTTEDSITAESGNSVDYGRTIKIEVGPLDKAERAREYRARKKMEAGIVPKDPKSPAQRMREYRARKKKTNRAANSISSIHHNHQKSVVEYSAQQMEESEDAAVEVASIPEKRKKTAAERAREYRSRKRAKTQQVTVKKEPIDGCNDTSDVEFRGSRTTLESEERSDGYYEIKLEPEDLNVKSEDMEGSLSSDVTQCNLMDIFHVDREGVETQRDSITAESGNSVDYGRTIKIEVGPLDEGSPQILMNTNDIRAKTSAQRGLEYRARKKKEAEARIHPKQTKTPSERAREYRARKNEKAGIDPKQTKTPAERAREYRARKKMEAGIVPKDPKSPAQRMREYRARKKKKNRAANSISSIHHNHQKSVVEYSAQQMEESEDAAVEVASIPEKRKKTAAERAREYRSRKRAKTQQVTVKKEPIDGCNDTSDVEFRGSRTTLESEERSDGYYEIKLEPEDLNVKSEDMEGSLSSDVTQCNLMDIFHVDREGVETQRVKKEPIDDIPDDYNDTSDVVVRGSRTILESEERSDVYYEIKLEPEDLNVKSEYQSSDDTVN